MSSAFSSQHIYDCWHPSSLLQQWVRLNHWWISLLLRLLIIINIFEFSDYILLDSEWNLVQSLLDWPLFSGTSYCGIRRHSYELAKITIEVDGQNFSVEAAVADKLQVPMLLGGDLPLEELIVRRMSKRNLLKSPSSGKRKPLQWWLGVSPEKNTKLKSKKARRGSSSGNYKPSGVRAGCMNSRTENHSHTFVRIWIILINNMRLPSRFRIFQDICHHNIMIRVIC